MPIGNHAVRTIVTAPFYRPVGNEIEAFGGRRSWPAGSAQRPDRMR